MYKTIIPVMNKKLTDAQKAKLVSELKKADPQAVMLIYGRILRNQQAKDLEYEHFIENKSFLEENGFTVGAWVTPTIGYGAPYYFDHDAPYTKIHTLKGNGDTIPGAYCPLYDDFTNELCSIFKRVAGTGVKLILLEDDFTLTGGKALFDRMGCCCEKHMAILRERLGENITVEELNDKVYRQGQNKYRDTFRALQGETLNSLADKIGNAIHSVNPEIRVGLSSNWSSFNIEGITLDKLAKTIAGGNKALIRLTGAPYWACIPNFATSIETARLESQWCRHKDIELLTEGDTFPRPRHNVPAALLEGFDTVLRADGKTDGILKYMVDYNSSATYETGYIERHVRNKPLYDEIERRFTGDTVGLNVLEVPEQFASIEFDADCRVEHYSSIGLLPVVSQWFMTDNGLPTTYENKEGAILAFGENAKYLDDGMLNRGVILDASGAKKLMKKGGDVGIESFERAKTPLAEKFIEEDELILASADDDKVFYHFQLKKGAKILSKFYHCSEGLGLLPPNGVLEENSYPACYLYENSRHQKFMVYSFSAASFGSTNMMCPTTVFRNYFRPKQLAKGIEWLQGEPLPATCFGHPNTYMLCRRNGSQMTVGIWNFFSDEIFTPEINLDREYTSLDCYCCEGSLDGSKVKLSTDIAPYGFACFTVK
ncbi:hypothetical protein [Fumia xinanensis]|uniref:Uncharacterized protein n=1 Tax=Fumia xinanensis TaxID=2763659 RepID=A0A926E1X8_9FIRM|nr:hypothetical protein [Fumia xinanensis]MBC8559806.1 hypothetical protein [Fumia xinanensis]